MLTTLDNVKKYIGITDTAEDGLLNMLIAAASQAIETYCNRVLTEHECVEDVQLIHSGGIVMLSGYPVSAVTIKDANGQQVTDFVLAARSGMLTINAAPGVYTVEYTAGYQTIPADLEFACIQLVAAMYDRRGSDHVVSETIGPVRAEYVDDIPQHIKWVLDRYRSPVV